MAKRPPFSLAQFLDAAVDDPRLAELLEDIRHEETPERLLDLARRLQEKLQESKHRRNPN